jgi:enoyl-CoA hydratase/carnithine racemase
VTENLVLRVDGPVATLRIDRPERRGALSFAMWSAVPGLVAEAAADPAVRVLVVRGTGGVFSAGADISEFQTLRAGSAGAARYAAAVHAGERAIAGFPRPTIAAISGYCIGGGCELALACDLRVAAADARFGITPAKLGIVYHFTSTQQLVAAVGPAWAKQILFTADLLDAGTALRIGLVNELADDLDARVAELAGRIAERSPVSVTSAKTIIGKITGGGAEDDEVRALYDTAVHSADYAEGVAAFLAKRPPVF